MALIKQELPISDSNIFKHIRLNFKLVCLLSWKKKTAPYKFSYLFHFSGLNVRLFLLYFLLFLGSVNTYLATLVGSVFRVVNLLSLYRGSIQEIYFFFDQHVRYNFDLYTNKPYCPDKV